MAVAHKALRVESDENGGILVCEHEGKEVRFAFDKILLALGRVANIDGFGLKELGITVTNAAPLKPTNGCRPTSRISSASAATPPARINLPMLPRTKPGMRQ